MDASSNRPARTSPYSRYPPDAAVWSPSREKFEADAWRERVSLPTASPSPYSWPASIMRLPALIVGFAAVAYAAKKEKDCTVKSVWPDGTEIERECIVEGVGKSKGGSGSTNKIHSEFKWLKDTRWHWNNWRDVIFRADGSFLAPAEGCEREGNPECRWSSDDEKVHARPGP